MRMIIPTTKCQISINTSLLTSKHDICLLACRISCQNKASMDRQRSFTFKPTRFLVFSFTICSSAIFLIFFTIWVLKATPDVLQQPRLQFNKSSLSVGHRLITAQTVNNFGRNHTAAATNVKIPDLTSNLHNQSISSGGFLLKEIQSDFEDVYGGDSSGTNLTTWQSVTELSRKFEVASNETTEDKKTGTKSFGSYEIIHSGRTEGNISISTSSNKTGVSVGEFKRIQDCDWTKGSWVYDANYPLYSKKSCPFIDEGFDCDANGRPDKNYMKWRWQPHDCNLPRFNATKMLELIRGKRLVFAGDSINRNQWESMLCMLMSTIQDRKRVYETHGRKITKEKGSYRFRFTDYQCTVEYYVSHFLVHESKARIGQKRRPTLRIDTMDRSSSRWRGADILVFNTAHWWSHYKTKAGIYYYQERDQVHPQLNVSTAFRKAMMTWSTWVDKHVNHRKTRVFFRSSSPTHFRGGRWDSGGHCSEASYPLNETVDSVYPEKNRITEEIIKQMKTPVTFLNISELSEYRIDGHPSIYGIKSDKKSYSVQDCSHWCLPGVPDVWNELLYFYLQST